MEPEHEFSRRRTAMIWRQIEAIKANYPLTTEGLKKAAEDKGVIVTETNLALTDFVTFVEGRGYMFLRQTRFPRLNTYSAAHELGHVLLNHYLTLSEEQKAYQEREAHYFATHLVGPRPDTEWSLEVLLTMLFYPIRSFREDLGYPDKIHDQLVETAAKTIAH